MKKLKYLFLNSLFILFSLIIMPVAHAGWDGESTYNDGEIYAFWNGQTNNPQNLVWTTIPWDQGAEERSNGTKVYTGTAGTNNLPLSLGMHRYTGWPKYIYIGYWERSTEGNCIHGGTTWHGIHVDDPDSMHICGLHYQDRYIGHCADCGGAIHLLVTGRTDTIGKISKVLNKSSYYYLCPHTYYGNDYAYNSMGHGHEIRSGHMEQGALFSHQCTCNSYNQYKIQYNINVPTDSLVVTNKLIIPKSGYFYNNSTTFEGQPCTPNVNLEPGVSSQIACLGYKFAGWYTKPSGGTKVTTWIDLQNATDNSVLAADNATIDVYAHWEKCEGTLILKDECAPSDKTFTVRLHEDKIVPAGVGGTYTVTLDANGGTVKTPTLTAKKVFDYWTKVLPFNAAYDKDTNIFHNNYEENGATFTLKAVYEPSEVTLPTPYRLGYEFLGWANSAGNIIGGSGDTYSVDNNVTLTAKWQQITLSLTSVENMTANNKYGAVDLEWAYSDKNSLTTFRAFRSAPNVNSNFVIVKSADTIAAETVINDTYTSDASYTVPETGYYTIELYGGQGSNYGSYTGGKGGYVYTKVFLKKGQIVSVYPGTAGNGATAGTNSKGFSGGAGSSSLTTSASSGGAASVVYIDNSIFAIAGGGGAASKDENGGAGGNTDATLLTSGSTGETGFTGGGAGYQGGIGSSTTFTNGLGTVNRSNARVTAHVCMGSSSSNGYCYTYDNHHYNKSCGHSDGELLCRQTVHTHQGWSSASNPGCYNTVNGTAIYGGHSLAYFCLGCGTRNENHSANCPTRRGTSIGQGGYCTICDKEYPSGTCYSNVIGYNKKAGSLKCTIPEHTHGYSCYHHCSGNSSSNSGCYTTYVHDSWGHNCGYGTGTSVLTCKRGEGGSNYIYTNSVGSGYYIQGTYQNSQNIGINAGNGKVVIKSVSVGYQMDTKMSGVYATDVNAPTIATFISKKTEADGKTVEVTFGKGTDVGTTYYFQVKAYSMASEAPIKESNITNNLLTSGLAGYRWLIDTNPTTAVTASNSTFVADINAMSKQKGVLTYDLQYMHIAYVDVAGNIAPALHVELGALNRPTPPPPEPIIKPHGTVNDPVLSVVNNSADGIYVNGSDLYIRGDGFVEAQLKISETTTPAYEHFLVDYLMFKENSNAGSNTTYFDKKNYTASGVSTAAKDTTYLEAKGAPIATFTGQITKWDETSKGDYTITTTQKFSLKGEPSFTLTPEATVTCSDCSVVTTKTGNTYTVKGDTTAPSISINHTFSISNTRNSTSVSTYLNEGTIPLYSYKCAIGNVKLTINATDGSSGVKSVKVYNDRMTDATPIATGNGSSLTIDMDGSHIYTVIAIDNVGNEREIVIQVDRDTTIPLVYDYTIDEEVSVDDHDNYIPKDPAADTSKITTIKNSQYYYTYGWTKSDVILKYHATDISGIKTMKLLSGHTTVGTTLTTGALVDTHGDLEYLVTEEGITKYTLYVEDVYGNIIQIFITVKIDKTPVTITGFELIKSLEGLDKDEYTEPINIQIAANDIATNLIADQSCIREFTVTVENSDNGLTRTYSTDSSKASASQYVIPITNGGITAKFTVNILEDDLIFFGDWKISAYACDIAWNESNDDGAMGEFTLKAELHSKLGTDQYNADGALLLKAGETGVLKVVTGGYADLIEVDFHELNDKGFRIYLSSDGKTASSLDPTTDLSYDASKFIDVTKAVDYERVENLANGTFTIYYQIVFPIDIYKSLDGTSCNITVTAYKGIDYTLDAEGNAVINKDGKKIKINASAVEGSEYSPLQRDLHVSIYDSIVTDYRTALSYMK